MAVDDALWAHVSANTFKIVRENVTALVTGRPTKSDALNFCTTQRSKVTNTFNDWVKLCVEDEYYSGLSSSKEKARPPTPLSPLFSAALFTSRVPGQTQASGRCGEWHSPAVQA